MKDYVEQKIAAWQVKGEFEKTIDYQRRVNNKSRALIIEEFQREALLFLEQQIVGQFESNKKNPGVVSLDYYDADNESFKIDISGLSSIVMGVDIELAPSFKETFNPGLLEIDDLGYSEGVFKIVRATYFPPSDLQGVHPAFYRFDAANETMYDVISIDYDFEELQLDFNEENIVHSDVARDLAGETKMASEEIKFQMTDSSYHVSSVAVIPEKVTDCDGGSMPADALASYTENNILSSYSVTDRRHLESILDEHRLQASGLTFEESLISRGCIENAQAYLFVQSGCLMGDEMIEIRLVHCETSTLIWSCTGLNTTPKAVLNRINDELGKTR